jgi:integrase
MKLTQKAVDAIGLDADRVVWDDDTPGLGVRVQSGRRSWIIRYRVGGVQRQKSLPGALPLKKARTQAAEIRTSAIRGSDVIAEAKAAAADARRGTATARTRALGKLVKSYLADAEKRLRPASLRVATLYLSKHWSSLHERPADELSRREIVEVLEPYAGRVTSAQMLHHLSACLTWAIDRGLIERHAAIGIKPPVQRVTRERVLTEAEMTAVWSATEGHGDGQADGSYFPILRVLLLTGQRREEVGAMRWSELDLDRGTWQLPGTRTKNGLPHDVPLPRQAGEIVRAIPRGDRECVFGYPTRGFVKWGASKRRLDQNCVVIGWTVHDLRRTAVTGMAEIGIAPHIVEAVVNHISGHKGGIAGVYNRAKYSTEKQAGLQRWADHVERIVAGDAGANVVAFR